MGLRMSARLLRQKYNREFAGLQKYTRLAASLILLGYIAQILVAMALGAALLSWTGPIWAKALGTTTLLLVIGTRLRALNNIIHECTHSTYASERSDNGTIGRVCAALLFDSFMDYRDEHLTHHAHVGDYEHDLDLQGIRNLGLHDALTPKVILRHLVTPLTLRHLQYYFKVNMSARDGIGYFALKVALLALMAGLTLTFPLFGLLFIVVPYVMVFTALNYWADCLDHAGLIPCDDELQSSRNILAPTPVRMMFFPRNDCYHLVHHLFPHVPARHLHRMHVTLSKDELYLSTKNAVRSEDYVESGAVAGA